MGILTRYALFALACTDFHSRRASDSPISRGFCYTYHKGHATKRHSVADKQRIKESVMELEGNRVAVLVEDNYADLDLWYPALRLQEAGAEVVIVGAEARRYTSRHGLPIQADIRVGQVGADDFDAIIIPGGARSGAMQRDAATVKLVSDMEQRGQVVATISDVDPTSTSAHDAYDEHIARFFDLKVRVQPQEGASTESTILRAGNLITACPPINLLAFCRAIMVALMAANSTPAAHLKDYG